MVLQAFKLRLPRSPLASPRVSSAIFEPHTQSLALIHPDSSLSLYPAVSPLTVPPILPPLPTHIPSPSSSSSFLLLRGKDYRPNSCPCVVFLVAGPHNNGDTVLLRFWVLRNSQVFARPRVVCTQNGLSYHEKLGVVMDASNHGRSLKISASINYFAMHLDSQSKIWVFGIKVDGNFHEEGSTFRLIKCAEVNCATPVWSINPPFSFLMMGIDSHVSVLPLRPLIKERIRKKGSRNEVTPRSLEQDEEEPHSTHLLPIKRAQNMSRRSDISPNQVRVVSIEPLLSNKFLVLDSTGYLHLLIASNTSIHRIVPLASAVGIQKIAAMVDISSDVQALWMTERSHSVHKVKLLEVETSNGEISEKANDEASMQLSVEQTIFTSEKVQDIVSLASTAVLILEQSEMVVYSTS